MKNLGFSQILGVWGVFSLVFLVLSFSGFEVLELCMSTFCGVYVCVLLVVFKEIVFWWCFSYTEEESLRASTFKRNCFGTCRKHGKLDR